MSKLRDLLDINAPGYVEGSGLVKKVNFVPGSGRGSSYIDITLADDTGEYPAKIWGDQSTNREEAAKMNGHVLRFRASVEDHDGRLRFLVQAGESFIVPDSEVNWTEYAWAMSDETKKSLHDFIEMFIGSMEDEGLKRVVSSLFDKYFDKLATLPAGFEWHHAYNGGLLRHIAEKLAYACPMSMLLPEFSAPYETVYDRDLVIAGCILSDFDKVFDLTPFPKGEKTALSRKRPTLSVFFRDEILPLCKKEMKRKKSTMDQTKLDNLEHVVLAGTMNATGSVKPYTAEANIVSLADRMSAETDHFGCFPYLSYTRTDGEQYSKMLGRFIEVRKEE